MDLAHASAMSHATVYVQAFAIDSEVDPFPFDDEPTVRMNVLFQDDESIEPPPDTRRAPHALPTDPPA